MLLPMNRAETTFQGQVFSPLSGLPAEVASGPNSADATLLFVHYGMAGLYGFVSDRIVAALELHSDVDVEDEDPENLLDLARIPGAFALQVDKGREGINTYGFAPALE